MRYIRKHFDGAVEYLPDVNETDLVCDYDASPTDRRNMLLYMALSDCENYYQFNSPTAFGNPDYARKEGFLYGLLTAYGLHIARTKESVRVVTENNRTIIVVDKLKKPDQYYKERKEAEELRNAFGIKPNFY